jgi:hypothetical protein
MIQRVLAFLSPAQRAGAPAAVIGLCLVLAACGETPPRSFADFMEDRIAMDGTIAYCNEHRRETENDIECANARRASAAIALRSERERREAYERESERKLAQMREEMVERERIVRETALAAARAEREAYEAMWRGNNNSPGPLAAPAPDRLSLIQLPPSFGPDTDE